MNQEKIVQLKQGITTAFINQNVSSNLVYKPQFGLKTYAAYFMVLGTFFIDAEKMVIVDE